MKILLNEEDLKEFLLSAYSEGERSYPGLEVDFVGNLMEKIKSKHAFEIKGQSIEDLYGNRLNIIDSQFSIGYNSEQVTMDGTTGSQAVVITHFSKDNNV